jgi:predicted RecA/RadA family phage recombinase
MPVLIGKMPGVAVDSYNAATGATVFALEGVYAIPVTATAALGVGDKVYAAGGTLDAATNVTTGIVISSVNTGVPFGAIFDAKILVGVTNPTALVRINQSV